MKAIVHLKSISPHPSHAIHEANRTRIRSSLQWGTGNRIARRLHSTGQESGFLGDWRVMISLAFLEIRIEPVKNLYLLSHGKLPAPFG